MSEDISINKPCALVVEDDNNLVFIFSKALEAAGFQTETVQDGAAASTRLKELTPAVVVLDLHLPGMSGEALLYQIRADERLAKTRVILATADMRLGTHLQTTADIVLIKPIDFKQLRDLASRLRPPIQV